MRRSGFTLTETLILGAVVVLVAVIGTAVLATERARVRDAKRIADITRLAGGFAVLYAQEGGYESAAAGCDTKGDPASSCTLSSLLTTGEGLQDPGKFSYTVSRVPDHQDFGISFRLERSYGTLAAGTHVLSKQGVR